MTVEELNVKISADSTNFRIELAAANNAMKVFRDDAVSAGKEVTAAFQGLIDTAVDAASKVSDVPGTNSIPLLYTPGQASAVAANSWLTGGVPETAPGLAALLPQSSDVFQRTANVLDLDKSETLIGAVSAPEQPQQPVNITTTVQLDGDKVGESVNRFNLRRHKITNGLYQ